jgi:hypothetical protein
MKRVSCDATPERVTAPAPGHVELRVSWACIGHFNPQTLEITVRKGARVETIDLRKYLDKT